MHIFAQKDVKFSSFYIVLKLTFLASITTFRSKRENIKSYIYIFTFDHSFFFVRVKGSPWQPHLSYPLQKRGPLYFCPIFIFIYLPLLHSCKSFNRLRSYIQPYSTRHRFRKRSHISLFFPLFCFLLPLLLLYVFFFITRMKKNLFFPL